MTVETKAVANVSALSVDGLIEVASRLIQVMTEETEILRDMRPGDIKELQEEKSRLSRVYEDKLRELRENPASLASMKPSLHRELQRVLGRFGTTVEANAAALKAAATANERLLRIIVDAVAEQRADTPGYSRHGTAAHANGTPTNVSISLNQQL